MLDESLLTFWWENTGEAFELDSIHPKGTPKCSCYCWFPGLHLAPPLLRNLISQGLRASLFPESGDLVHKGDLVPNPSRMFSLTFTAASHPSELLSRQVQPPKELLNDHLLPPKLGPRGTREAGRTKFSIKISIHSLFICAVIYIDCYVEGTMLGLLLSN